MSIHSCVTFPSTPGLLWPWGDWRRPAHALGLVEALRGVRSEREGAGQEQAGVRAFPPHLQQGDAGARARALSPRCPRGERFPTRGRCPGRVTSALLTGGSLSALLWGATGTVRASRCALGVVAGSASQLRRP